MRIAAVLAGIAIVAGPVCGAWKHTVTLGTNVTPSAVLQAHRIVNGSVTGVPAIAGTRPAVGDVPTLAAVDVGKRSVTNDLPVILAVDARSCDAAIFNAVEEVMPADAGGGAVGLRDLCSIGAAAGVNAGELLGLLPAYETFGVSRSVAREVDGFGRLAGAAGVDTNRVVAFNAVAGAANYEVDPFLSLIDIWDAGPLGEMQRKANLMRSRGDAAAFDDAAAGYWQAMNTAVARREAFGGRGKRPRATVGQ